MAVNQSYAIGWLVRRIEWERALADLHAQAHIAHEPHDASDEATVRARPEPRAERIGSPIRGMSRRRTGRKIRKHGRATRSGVVVG